MQGNPIVSGDHGSTPTCAQEIKNRRPSLYCIKTMACYPGDCPIRPQSPRIPSYTCQPVTRWLPAADALPGRQRSDALSFCGVHTAAAKILAKPLSPIMAALPWNPPITWGFQSVPVAFGVVVAVLVGVLLHVRSGCFHAFWRLTAAASVGHHYD